MVVDLGQFGDVISFDISSMDNMNLRPFASLSVLTIMGRAFYWEWHLCMMIL
jgi:hypothetical protein